MTLQALCLVQQLALFKQYAGQFLSHTDGGDHVRVLRALALLLQHLTQQALRLVQLAQCGQRAGQVGHGVERAR
eukprot:scaffold84659_cov17-Tisochrysis_lutea.AAC.1